jgi:hypothetical protein
MRRGPPRYGGKSEERKNGGEGMQRAVWQIPPGLLPGGRSGADQSRPRVM